MDGLKAALALGAGTVLLLGVISGFVKNRLWISEPLIALLVGILVGPLLVLVELDPSREDQNAVLREAARTRSSPAGWPTCPAACAMRFRPRAARMTASRSCWSCCRWLCTRPAPEAINHWLLDTLLQHLIGGIAVGLAIGWVAGRCLRWAYASRSPSGPRSWARRSPWR